MFAGAILAGKGGILAPREPNRASDWSKTIHVFGDIHVGNSGQGLNGISISRLGLLAASAKKISTPAAMVQIGDLSHHGDATYEDPYSSAYWNALPSAPVKRNILGNHDLGISGASARSAATAVASLGLSPKDWMDDLGAFCMIGVSPETGRSDGDMVLTTNDLNALQARLESTSKPCLIFAHAPLYNTVLGPTTGPEQQSPSNAELAYMKPDATIRSLLDSHSNAKAWICGHTHSEIWAPGLVEGVNVGSRSIASVNVSAIYYTGAWQNGAGALPEKPLRTAFVTFQGDHLEVRFFDWSFHRWAPWPDGTFVQNVSFS